MDPTERPLPSTDSLPDQTDTLLEAVFTRYIRSGTAETGSEPGRLVVEMARHAGSKNKDSFEEFYAILGGAGLTSANASAVSKEFVASCIGGGGGGRCNWGRVVTALAFSRLVAGKLLADGKDGESLDDYSASVGKALARFVREWRSREGQDFVSLQINIMDNCIRITGF